MTRRYYPSTRERITRAFDQGVRSRLTTRNPYAWANSGKALHRAFTSGRWLARFGIPVNVKQLPVVDLSAEFADVIRDVEPDLAGRLDRNEGGRAE